ncbi:MAG: ABC transporter permease [Clostridium baratii]|uniref:Binding--dependent transport system inner membrane component family protein n=2 Tax=Clostridium baratii TaxID=1561 RepID=A0A0A7FVG6_9CLOT|nr:ABC transporter permease [Clostridium baratii]AIY83583.1 binding--dependent transport system inner membrane component family protein [Clostridium baratii str. Sullivan]MBS6006493.1 ABC transporter permease [Clostridium baratii]MDU1053836.1 ABC transporter permease [Clostridium baratii]CUO92998.1 spermidine/putrescine ABC transporter [Clostridium baratii]
MNKNKKSLAAYPYIIWSAIFIIVPLLMILFFSLTIDTDTGYQFSLENFQRLMNPLYFKIFGRSLLLAVLSTVVCLLIGYPVAYIVSKMPENKRNLVIMLFILPMWMNFLLRTYAWLPILGKNGIVNNFLGIFGIEPIQFLYTNGAIMLGMIYNFLPFMILPIYTVLSKIDTNLINAASDLGANKKQIFAKVIFPLSIPGVISGITMVFMPAVSTFVIPRLLGGGKDMLIGNVIEQQFTTLSDWHFGSALAIILMILILISMAVMSRFDGEQTEGGGRLW